MSELECLAYGVGADEGICLLLKLGRYQVLLDCGLTDPGKLLATKAVLPADLVLCSHAHADHARGLLALHQAFPQLPIYASEVTTQLLPLNWSTGGTSRTEAAAARQALSLCHALPWRTPIEFFDGLTVELYPSGHLPGAASFLLTYAPPAEDDRPVRPYTVFYTGDFFLSNARLVEGMPLEELRGLEPDVLIVEGSYGTARHIHRRQQENQLAERIDRAIAEKQSILMPVPALGLGQELLMLLRSHHHFTGRDLDVWVDGSVAAGCDAYLEILPHLPTSVQNFARHQALFWDERVRPRVRHLTPDQWNQLTQRPSIVLTDVTTDLSQYYADNPDGWLILEPLEPHYSGDRGQGTGDKNVKPFSGQTRDRSPDLSVEKQPPSATTRPKPSTPHPTPSRETYLLAQHCDGPGTTQLIHNLRPQHVIFIHGSPTYLADLTGLEELHNRYHLHTPSANSLVELPIGETFLHAAAPEASYEGELTELNMSVTITLPDAIIADPRWQQLADTGLVEARWQGDELVLRGLPQRELLRPNDRLLDWMDANSPLRNCCGNCRHYRGQRCWNQLSPLFEFKVTPDGFCPVFEPAQTPEERT
ncbi:MAG: MBL fold metallo-hydrolase [Leptolyngbya sp. BL-A-14]